MAEIRDMVGKEVEVNSNGMVYRGKLIEVTSDEVHLKGPLQWIALPVATIGSVKLAGSGPAGGLDDDAARAMREQMAALDSEPDAKV